MSATPLFDTLNKRYADGGYDPIELRTFAMDALATLRHVEQLLADVLAKNPGSPAPMPNTVAKAPPMDTRPTEPGPHDDARVVEFPAWISVLDSLPSIPAGHTSVDVIAYYAAPGGLPRVTGARYERDGWHIENALPWTIVTHWMPPPSAPGSASNERSPQNTTGESK